MGEREMRRSTVAGVAGVAALAASAWAAVPARADLVVTMNDNHTVLNEKMDQVPPKNLKPDSVSLIDVSHYPPTIVATFEAPGSVVGPPLAVWVAKDESWAITTAATKVDPSAPLGIGPDDRVSVIDLKSSPPRVVQTVHAGPGATVVRVSPDGTLALVCNRTEGSVSIFTVKDKRLEPAGKLDLGKQSGPSSVVFLQDGLTALVSRQFDHMVSVLHIDGTNVTIDPRPITTALGPYTMDINAAGTLAAVGNMGRSDGDVDSVSLIDLTDSPMRTVETAGVPGGPEPLKFSPDGRYLAVGSQVGTTKPRTSPLFRDRAQLTVFEVRGKHLQKVAEAPIGRWAEGIAFSRDGQTILVQNNFEQTISVFRFVNNKLTAGAPLRTGGGPVAFGTAWP